jgi:hypothetical protein
VLHALLGRLLWLQSNRTEAEDEAALASATDLALVLANETDAAFCTRDSTKLSALYAEFAAHV